MKYLAWDPVNCDHEQFDTIEEARSYLEECFLHDGAYHPDITSFAIYELKETVSYDVTDRKSDYKYENEEDIPEGDNESES